MMNNEPSLTLADAQRVIAVALDVATERGVSIAAAVTDFGGHLIAFARMDGVSYVIAAAAGPKAVAAGAFAAPTHALVAGMARDATMASNIALAAARNPEMLIVPGGLPVIHGGRCVGGLGISGGRGDEDQEVGATALDLLSR